VDFAVISEELGSAKPEPEIFREALRRASVASHEAVFVGDSQEFDVAGARGAGMSAVWHNATAQAWQGPGERPQLEIASIAQLPPLIGSPSLLPVK
jgi:putative hydrolase of the HAD superfamily